MSLLYSTGHGAKTKLVLNRWNKYKPLIYTFSINEVDKLGQSISSQAGDFTQHIINYKLVYVISILVKGQFCGICGHMDRDTTDQPLLFSITFKSCVSKNF